MTEHDVFIHETAIVEPGAVIGDGSKVWHFSHVCAGAILGRRCSLGQNVYVSGKTKLGSNVKVQNNVSIYDGVTLEDDVFCGPSMVFTNVVNPRSHVSRKSEFLATHVGQGATLGANCTVVCGVKIGRYAFVGAGSVVTRDVGDYALVYGNPARPKGWMCVCGTKLGRQDAMVCRRCAARYELLDGYLRIVEDGSSSVRPAKHHEMSAEQGDLLP